MAGQGFGNPPPQPLNIGDWPLLSSGYRPRIPGSGYRDSELGKQPLFGILSPEFRGHPGTANASLSREDRLLSVQAIIDDIQQAVTHLGKNLRGNLSEAHDESWDIHGADLDDINGRFRLESVSFVRGNRNMPDIVLEVRVPGRDGGDQSDGQNPDGIGTDDQARPDFLDFCPNRRVEIDGPDFSAKNPLDISHTREDRSDRLRTWSCRNSAISFSACSRKI